MGRAASGRASGVKAKPDTHPSLFDFDDPPVKRSRVKLPPLKQPIWTENKAKLIERYLYYFVLVTKHGNYIDGFAGPQYEDQLDAWAARLVLESEPRWLRKFFLCDAGEEQFAALSELRAQQPPPPKGYRRYIHLYHGDFNEKVAEILGSGLVREKEATFCLLDQRTFECKWSTVERLASHKAAGHKVELFYSRRVVVWPRLPSEERQTGDRRILGPR